MTKQVYTDGACSGNPGPGGWAWIVPGGPFGAGNAAETTNQRMELQAVLSALESIEGEVEVISDSTYVVNCFRDGWWKGWLTRGWKNSQKKPVANRDLWEPLIELYQQRADELTFTWVKGHSGNEWNDYADRLAVEAGFLQQPRSGDSTPTQIGEPDKVRRSTKTAAPAASAASGEHVDGRSIVVLGHQPPELGGYGENALTKRLILRIEQILRAKAELDPDLVVLTGLRLGAEQLGAQAARNAGIPYVAVLPFPDPDARWPETSRAEFASLLSSAASVVQLSTKAPADKAKVAAAMRKRTAWFSENAQEALVIWDGKEPFVKKTVDAMEAALEDDVWIIDPNEV